MANTLSSLIPDAFAALNVVSRELTGFIPSVMRDSSADRVAVGQTLRSAVAPASTATDITAAMALPSAAYQTITNKTFSITKSRAVMFSWQGTEERAMNAGPGFLTIQQNQVAEAFRTLVNEVEADLAALYNGASRAYGTAGMTPFASTLADPANVRKILDDNGAPPSDRSLVINTTAGVGLRTLAQLTKANESGDTSMLRQGTILDIHGFAIRESAQIKSNAVGTGASYVLNGSHAIGATTITVKTGSGTILAGDVVTINSVKYVVATALTSTTLVIAAPGLLAAGADSDTVTVNAIHAANMAFSRNAILLGTRLPDLPSGGDIATDRETITDPRSGISMELAYYPGFRMNTYFVGMSWGAAVIKPEHLAILLG